MIHPPFKLELVGIDEIRPSISNPRESEEEKLELIRLSLVKFGFLIPIYVSLDGEILSGHQRHLVCKRLGLKKIPVIFLRNFKDLEQKAINILFNRGTNDLKQKETTETVTKDIESTNIREELEDLQDLSPGEIVDRVMNFKLISLKSLELKNYTVDNLYSRNIASKLFNWGIYIPIIVTHDGKIVNGVGRMEFARQKGFDSYPCVEIREEEKDILHLLLNKLTMNFSINKDYADILRFNSHRRIFSNDKENTIGRAFLIGIKPKAYNQVFNLGIENNNNLFRRIYGETILDWGAGTLHDTKMLNAHGFKCVPFEPYYTNGKQNVDKEVSIQLASAFLLTLENGIKFDSIVLSAILNSVPFYKDREHILRIVSAIANRSNSKVFSTVQSVYSASMISIAGESHSFASQTGFLINYEPNISIADISKKPKIQKFFSEKEVYNLFKKNFKTVSVITHRGYVQCIASEAIEPDIEELNASLDFEFELPYSDGGKMGLSQLARNVFCNYLK